MRTLVLSLALPAALVSSWSSLAYAGPPKEDRAASNGKSDPYDAARDAESRLDYRAVLTYASAALQMANTHERLVEIYRLLGTANGVLGKNDDAIDAFTRLLAVEPDFRLSRGMSPKITKPFKEAGGYWMDRPGGLGLSPNLPREVGGGKPLMVSIKLEDPLQMATKVRLSYRQEGIPEYTKVEALVDTSIAFTIPADQLPPRKTDYVVELYFTALAVTGSELRSSGDAAHPLTVTVRASREELNLVAGTSDEGTTQVGTAPARSHTPKILKKWWFWTAVGGVIVIGAALGGGLGYYYSRDTSHVDLTLTSRTAP